MKELILTIAFVFSLFGLCHADQHDYDLANNPGASFRADLNNALDAISTNNAGATAPSTLIADMWWFDSSTSILKQRTHANDAWVNVASKSGSNWIPYRNGTLIGTAAVLTSSTDGTLASNSDSNVATQKATKTYADTKISKSTAGELNSLSEKTSLVANDLVLIEDSEASYAKKKAKKSAIGSGSGVHYFSSSGTFNAPSGITKVYLTMVGGGGGGAGTLSTNQPGGGGGSGAWVIMRPYTVTPGNSYTVTVGSGGVGGGNNVEGSDGGSTSFDSFSVAGGSGGQNDFSAPNGGSGGSAAESFNASSSVSVFTRAGGSSVFAGSNGARGGGGSAEGGGGGGTPWGAGGNGGQFGGVTNGAAGGANTGAGGGGAQGSGGLGSSGGNGGSGFVAVSW